MTDKHDSIISLPGGVESYAETLHEALAFVEGESPTREEFADWILETFPQMSSRDSAVNKGLLLGRMGVADVDGDQFQLTELGTRLLNTPPQENPELYFETLTDHYLGFDAILRALKQQPASMETLRDVLNAVHDKEWESLYQADYRINWLRSLGIVEKDDEKIQLTSRGQEIAENYPELDIDISDLPESTIQVPTDGPDPQSTIDLERFGGDATYYWVNQSNAVERENNYLRSSDTLYTRDLTKLNPGDVLIHHWEGGVRAYSVVQTEAYEVPGDELDGGEDGETYWRVDVGFHSLDPVRDIQTIGPVLLRDDIKQGKKKYAINATGGVQSWYLCNLTPAAAEYLLSTYPDEPDGTEPDDDRYFWVTANPEIWEPENIADTDGEAGQMFFEAYNSRGNQRRVYDAFEGASPGDAVVFYESAPTQEIVALGTIVQGLHEEDGTPGITIEYDRTVDGISWNDLTAVGDLEMSAPLRQNARGTIFELEETEYKTILALEPEPPDQADVERLRDRLSLPRISISIPDGLYFDDKSRITREIEAALDADKHIIFTGPPGTGKTKLATHVARLAAEYDAVDDYRFTTATADWTAFDTVGGYVPNRNRHGQELLFEPRLFLQCFRDASGVKNEWLVIDELNRADIDKAIGQLFSVLSGDSTELPYERDEAITVESLDGDADDETLEEIVASQDAFPVTPAWRLLATMNTYDKASLYELSYAFMRRFAFIHVGVPNLVERGDLRTSLLNPNGDENFASAWTEQSPDLEATLEEVGEELVEVWHRVNEERAIGPAIVHDMVRYIAKYDGRAPPTHALTSAITTHVYPQLEGLRQEKQQSIIEGLCSGDVPVDPDQLWGQANDFLELPDSRDNE